MLRMSIYDTLTNKIIVDHMTIMEINCIIGKFKIYYASATALAAPPKDLGESGAAVRIYTGQEWPIFKVIFDPFPPAPASWPLNILFSSFSRVRSFKPRRKIPIRTVFITCQKTPKCASRESSSSSFFLSFFLSTPV